jgi:hypothetical protein
MGLNIKIMKTAMQELRHTVNMMIAVGGDCDLIAVINHIDNLLEKEKQQIRDSFISGQWHSNVVDADYYYYKKFKQ